MVIKIQQFSKQKPFMVNTIYGTQECSSLKKSGVANVLPKRDGNVIHEQICVKPLQAALLINEISQNTTFQHIVYRNENKEVITPRFFSGKHTCNQHSKCQKT